MGEYSELEGWVKIHVYTLLFYYTGALPTSVLELVSLNRIYIEYRNRYRYPIGISIGIAILVRY